MSILAVEVTRRLESWRGLCTLASTSILGGGHKGRARFPEWAFSIQ
jgi:hypothetical protein